MTEAAEAQLSFYIELEAGQTADLEIVAKAAIAWSEAIKEAAYLVDPSSDLRIELASGTQGSLSLNTILKSVRGQATDPQTIKTVIVTALIWMGAQTLEYSYARILDALTGDDAPPIVKELSDEEIDEIAEKVAVALGSRVVEAKRREMWIELERDPVIKGAGVSTIPGQRPRVVIPRSEFSERAGRGDYQEYTEFKRVGKEKVRVTLIRPVLVPGRRRWGLRSSEGEFGAAIKDEEFLDQVLSGNTSIPMMAGIQMDVELETTEERIDGVWRPVERNVLKVIELHRPPQQAGLPFSTADNEPNNTTGR